MMFRTVAIVAVLIAGTARAQSVHVISDRPLPSEAARARDVRWASDDSVYVSSFFTGVHQVRTASGASTRVGFAEAGKTCPSCSSLAASNTHIVTAFPVYHLAWKHVGKPQIHNFLFDAIVDIDVNGDRLLMLASRTEGKERKWAPDGAIAWTGSLDRRLGDLRPVLFSSRGAREMTIARCGFLEPGAVRFFSDGSFVIVPGVEPDVYLYDPKGRLAYTWQTAKLGFVDRCELPESQVHALSADPEQRARWRSNRVMLDDVLPTPAGPALLLHEYRAGVARWTMVVLRRNAPLQRIPLPFTVASDVASLRADIRGNRLAFLVRTGGEWRQKTRPAPARLIVAELR